MTRLGLVHVAVVLGLALATPISAAERLPPAKLDPVPKPLASDPSVKIDYDIVYVRAPRFVPGRDGKQRPSAWPEIAHPTNIDAGYDLMLLHPDGSEEVLVAGGEGSIADPYVSFDGEWVYYAHFYLGKLGTGADIYKVHVKTQEDRPADAPGVDAEHRLPGVRQKTPAPPSRQAPIGRGVYNLGPCPLPGGRRRLHQHARPGQGAARLSAGGQPALRHGRRRQERREDRPHQHRQRPAPGRPQGRPRHVQLARVAGRPRQHRLGHLEHPPRRHQLGADHQRPVRLRRRRRRLPLPDAALRRQPRRRAVLQPEHAGLRHLLQAAAARPGGRAAVRLGAQPGRRHQGARLGGPEAVHARPRHASACRSSPTAWRC